MDLILDRVEQIKRADAEKLLSALWQIDGQIEDKRSGLFELDDFYTKTSRLTYQFLKNSIPEEAREKFLLKLLQETKSVYFSTRLIGYFDEKVEKNETDMLVNKEFLKTYRDAVLKVINSKAKANELDKETRLDIILFKWSEWENPAVVSNYIAKLITTKTGLFHLLSGFTGLVHSSNEGTYKTFGKEPLGKLYSIEKIASKVESTKKDKQLSKEEKELLNLFENPPKTW